jgi:membrane fusion protein
VQPSQAAVVLGQPALEGQEVHAGDTLLTLAAELPGLDDAAQRTLQATFDQRLHSFDDSARRAGALAEQQALALDRRLEGLRDEAAQLAGQIGWQAKRLALAEAAQARLESLERDQFVSASQVQAKSEEVLGLRADAAGLSRQRQAILRERLAVEAERRELPLQTAQRQAELARERGDIMELAARADRAGGRRVWALKAPADGVVSAMNVVAGQAVTADMVLATLAPAGAQLQAHLYAPSSALGFLELGQAVHLRLQAFPYAKYGGLEGHVVQVAKAPIQAVELGLALLAPLQGHGEPLYRVVVTLPRQTMLAGGSARALLPGMQLEADVTMERRRLIEWVAEPLLAWRERR